MECNHQFFNLNLKDRTRVVCALCSETRDLWSGVYKKVTHEDLEQERQIAEQQIKMLDTFLEKADKYQMKPLYL
jgi:hypothetical protein